MRRRRILLGLASTVYDKLLIAALQLLMVPLLLTHWGVPLYGCWVILATVPAFLALADLGFGGAAFVRMTAMVARGDRDGAVTVLQTACQLVAGASLVAMTVGLMAIAAVPETWLPTDAEFPVSQARAVLAMLMLYTLVVLQSSLFSGSFSSVGLFPLYAFTNAHVYLLECVLIALVVIGGYGPVAAAVAMLASRLAGLVMHAALLRRREPWLRYGFARASRTERHILARSARGMLAVPLGQATALQGTVLALGAAAGPAAAPVFVAARTLSRIALQMTQLLNHALLPEFAAAQAKEDSRGQAAMLTAVIALSVAVSLPLAVVLAFGGDWILRLWTAGALVASAGLMPTLAMSVLLGGLWAPLSSLMYAVDRQDAFAWWYLGGGIVAVAVTAALASALGATGAALALAVLDGVMVAVVGRFAWRFWLRGLPMVDVARAALRQGRAALQR